MTKYRMMQNQFDYFDANKCIIILCHLIRILWVFLLFCLTFANPCKVHERVEENEGLQKKKKIKNMTEME